MLRQLLSIRGLTSPSNFGQAFRRLPDFLLLSTISHENYPHPKKCSIYAGYRGFVYGFDSHHLLFSIYPVFMRKTAYLLDFLMVCLCYTCILCKVYFPFLRSKLSIFIHGKSKRKILLDLLGCLIFIQSVPVDLFHNMRCGPSA